MRSTDANCLKEYRRTQASTRYHLGRPSPSQVDWESTIRLSWGIARQNILACPFRILIPSIKLREPKTHSVLAMTSCPGVVIKAHELLSNSGKGTNSLHRDIVRAGGLHSYYGFRGQIILSSVMKDALCQALEPSTYMEMIRDLRPDFYLTPDGMNYLDRPRESWGQIKKRLAGTDLLLRAGLEARPLGLVKGATSGQIEWHGKQLMEMGIRHHIIHVGTAFRTGTASQREEIKNHYERLKKISHWLLAYGIGAASTFREFQRCDGYITHSHYSYRFKKGVGEDDPGYEIMENLAISERELLNDEIARMDGVKPMKGVGYQWESEKAEDPNHA